MVETMTDPMQKYKDYGKTPEGLRHFAHKMLAHNREFGGGYAICVFDSAAEELQRLSSENVSLLRKLSEATHPTLL